MFKTTEEGLDYSRPSSTSDQHKIVRTIAKLKKGAFTKSVEPSPQFQKIDCLQRFKGFHTHVKEYSNGDGIDF